MMMMKFKPFAVLVLVVVLAAFNVYAGDTGKEAEKEKPRELKNQTNCPVMGGKIDSSAYTDIQGQRVYHCCPGCSKSLKADPDKYFKKAAEEGILFENIQTTCPVSGEELKEKKAFTDYEGRRVYFCCEMCIDTFTKDAAKYLDKMDEPAGEKMQQDEKMGHEGHNQ
jgi:YHS domain-containing protein